MAEKWTKDQINFLKNNYGVIPKEVLCEKLNRTWNSIRNKAIRENIKSQREWAEEEIQYLKDNYKSKTYNEIAKTLGRSKAAVDLKINRLGLVKSKYEYNHNFFQDIQTEAQAYWCGFIMADGCVSVNKKTNSCELCIKLQASDSNHLKKFNKSISGNVPVTFFDEYVLLPNKTEKFLSHQCQIRLYSEEIVHDLEKYGVIQNKSLVKQFPKNIPEHLMNHFIRGYFDGNGTIIFSQKSRSCSFCTGSESFANSLYRFINDNVCKTSNVYKTNDVHSFRFQINSCSSIYSFLNYLYTDATIYLDRKFHKKEQFFNSTILERYLLRHPEMVG